MNGLVVVRDNVIEPDVYSMHGGWRPAYVTSSSRRWNGGHMNWHVCYMRIVLRSLGFPKWLFCWSQAGSVSSALNCLIARMMRFPLPPAGCLRGLWLGKDVLITGGPERY